MASFSGILKTFFWLLLILQVAPPLIQSIIKQYSQYIEPHTKVGILDMQAPIYSSRSYVANLKKLYEDDSIKAVLLRIDSPGGLSGSSQALFAEIKTLKAQNNNKPTVAVVENMAASGAYYVASAADRIVATPSALIGSIGAYIQHPNAKDFLEYHKLHYSISKAGEYKGAGNPLLELTDKQKEQFQELVTDMYEQFTQDIKQQRPLVSAHVNEWADGRLFTGQQALGLKLIDAVGSQSTATALIKELAHIEGKIEWINPATSSGVSWLNRLFFGQPEEDTQADLTSSIVNSCCNVIEQRYATLKSY